MTELTATIYIVLKFGLLYVAIVSGRWWCFSAMALFFSTLPFDRSWDRDLGWDDLKKELKL